MRDLLTSGCCRKATTSHNVCTYSDDSSTRIDHQWVGNVARRHVVAVLDCQTLHEHTPDQLGLVALDVARLGHPVHLKRHEPSIHLVEQPLPDPKDDIRSMHSEVDRQDERCTSPRYTQVSVPAFLGSDGKQPTTLGLCENL